MNILITGGSGFIGRHLSRFLLEKGHSVTALGYRQHKDLTNRSDFEYLAADTTKSGPWQTRLAEVDAVINLAGQTIFKRWTRRYKRQIYDSRILTTRHIVQALPTDRAVTLCSASAVGYYGDRKDDPLTESEPPGDDFLARVGYDWEMAALAARESGARVVLARFGIVFGRGGGALSKMIPAFKSFAGGPLGSGNQWFPWIHMDDLTAAVLFVLQDPGIQGPVNFCAPNPVRNRDLARALGSVLNRPALLPVPEFMIRLGLGEVAGALLASQRVIPERLTRCGFSFAHPEIEGAIAAVVGP